MLLGDFTLEPKTTLNQFFSKLILLYRSVAQSFFIWFQQIIHNFEGCLICSLWIVLPAQVTNQPPLPQLFFVCFKCIENLEMAFQWTFLCTDGQIYLCGSQLVFIFKFIS